MKTVLYAIGAIAIWGLIIYLFFYKLTPTPGMTADPHAYDPRAFRCDKELSLPCDGVRR